MPKATKKAKKPATKPKKAASKKAKPSARRAKQVGAPAPEAGGERLTFNHAMVYVKDVQRALAFYHDLLGFKLIEDFRYEGKPVYARLRAPGGDGTIALHLAGPDQPLTRRASDSISRSAISMASAANSKPATSTSRRCRA